MQSVSSHALKKVSLRDLQVGPCFQSVYSKLSMSAVCFSLFKLSIMYSGLSMQVVALKQFFAPPRFQSFPFVSMRYGFQDSSCQDFQICLYSCMVRECALEIMLFALLLSAE